VITVMTFMPSFMKIRQVAQTLWGEGTDTNTAVILSAYTTDLGVSRLLILMLI
jgi:hypothetical protein